MTKQLSTGKMEVTDVVGGPILNPSGKHYLIKLALVDPDTGEEVVERTGTFDDWSYEINQDFITVPSDDMLMSHYLATDQWVTLRVKVTVKK